MPLVADLIDPFSGRTARAIELSANAVERAELERRRASGGPSSASG